MESRHSDLRRVKDNKPSTSTRYPSARARFPPASPGPTVPPPARLPYAPVALQPQSLLLSQRDKRGREAYYGSSNSARAAAAVPPQRTTSGRTGGRACTVLLRNIERVHFAPAEGGARTGPTTSFYADSVTAKVREAQQTALMDSVWVGPG